MAVGAFALGIVADLYGFRGIYVAGFILIVAGGLFFTIYQKLGKKRVLVLREKFEQK